MWDLSNHYPMKFICKNQECVLFNLEVVEPSVIIGFKNGEVTFDRKPCPECKSDREIVSIMESFKDKNIMVAEQFGSSNKQWSKSSKNTIY